MQFAKSSRHVSRGSMEFLFKLKNNLLLSHFDIFKPTLGVVCSFYDIRKLLFLLPKPNIELQNKFLEIFIIKITEGR